MHLRNQASHTGVDSSIEGGREDGNILLSGAAVILNFVDCAIQGDNCLPGLLLSLRNGDGVAGDLVLEGAGDLAQGAESVAGVFFNRTHRTDSVVAGRAVGVDFHSDVLLAAGNSLHLHLSLQRIVKWNQLVRGRHFEVAVDSKTGGSHILATINTVHSSILLTASLALDLVRILHRAGEGSRKQVDEYAGRQILNPIVRDLAHLAPELMWRIEFSLLEAFDAEGVQAGKGLWVLDSIITDGTLDQLGNYS